MKLFPLMFSGEMPWEIGTSRSLNFLLSGLDPNLTKEIRIQRWKYVGNWWQTDSTQRLLNSDKYQLMRQKGRLMGRSAPYFSFSGRKESLMPCVTLKRSVSSKDSFSSAENPR